ncbi:hypothetical protein NHP190003_03850 [Helicobacter sp. NHP19-003]|uniref:Uncharacterized protein n=1 Tax=Helicobacter gastrocanis TaxID=2849641 RepID=A0ABN6I0B3_9HELI|nr:hypothetical protein NHP190003_03420 [Helicobacter sp. NHP19-003]BCZ17103.1 hypothetical protein NHP190003_03850 [Helicobacter sp. NHP19-003]
MDMWGATCQGGAFKANSANIKREKGALGSGLKPAANKQKERKVPKIGGLMATCHPKIK